MARTKNTPARRGVAFVEEEKWQPADGQIERKQVARGGGGGGDEKLPSLSTPLYQQTALIPHIKSKASLPPWMRFPAVLGMSLFLSSIMYSVSAQWTHGELASVSRKYEGWGVLAGLLGWRG